MLIAALACPPLARAAFKGTTTVPVTLGAGALTAPTGLTLTASCAGSTPSVAAGWTASAGGVTPQGYNLSRQLSGTTQNTVQSAGTSATDTGMANGQTYTYRLVSYRYNWLSATAATGSVAVNCATNLFTNSGFESGTTTAPWVYDANGAAAAVSTTFQHAGANSMRIPVSFQAYETMTLTANKTYTFSVWAYTAVGTGATSAKLRAVIGSTPWGTEISNIQGSGTPGTWHQVTLSFNTGSNTTITLLIGSGGAQYDVFIDDVSLS